MSESFDLLGRAEELQSVGHRTTVLTCFERSGTTTLNVEFPIAE